MIQKHSAVGYMFCPSPRKHNHVQLFFLHRQKNMNMKNKNMKKMKNDVPK